MAYDLITQGSVKVYKGTYEGWDFTFPRLVVEIRTGLKQITFYVFIFRL